MRTPSRAAVPLVALALLAAACACSSGGGAAEPTTEGHGALSPIVASTDLYADAPQRVQVGLVFADGTIVNDGEVAFRFAYTGTQSNPISPTPGPEATARYLPTPGQTRDAGAAARATAPSEARGVYEATDVTFAKAGVWTVEVSVELEDGDHVGSTAFLVDTQARIPAPGDPAFETDSLVVGDASVPLGAIDSRAIASGSIPDPDLHATTIAEAIAAGRPTLVLFATPTFCMSQFCGPSVDTLAAMAESAPADAALIHVEIWKDYAQQQLNDAAIEWLYRSGDLHEPWLFLIGRDGRIVDRWGPLFDPEEILAELREAAA